MEAAKQEAADDLDEGEMHWDTELGDLKGEKSKAFTILAQFVPQSEIFFNNQGASKEKLKQKQLKEEAETTNTQN